MTSNLEEDANKGKPSDETTEEQNTSAAQAEKKTEPGDEVDYKVKFSESSKEAQRLLDENARIKQELVQAQDVMDTLYDNPDLLKQVQGAYNRKINPTQETEDESELGIVSDKVLEKKVRDVVSPITQELEQERRMRVDEVVSDFNLRHPEAAEGSDTWKQVVEWLPAMKAKGLPLKQGLEKAYEIVSLDQAKRSGKKEDLSKLFEKSQAAAGGGASGSAQQARSDEDLTSEQKKVAAGLGVKPESYAKNKRSK